MKVVTVLVLVLALCYAVSSQSITITQPSAPTSYSAGSSRLLKFTTGGYATAPTVFIDFVQYFDASLTAVKVVASLSTSYITSNANAFAFTVPKQILQS